MSNNKPYLNRLPPSNQIEQSFHAAIQLGVQNNNGVYRFFDPGISLLDLRNMPIVRARKLICRTACYEWYDSYDWAQQEESPQERIIRCPAQFGDQGNSSLIEVVSIRSMTTLLLIQMLSTGNRLLNDYYVRCKEHGEPGERIVIHFDGFFCNSIDAGTCRAVIGRFNEDGIHFHLLADDDERENVRLGVQINDPATL